MKSLLILVAAGLPSSCCFSLGDEMLFPPAPTAEEELEDTDVTSAIEALASSAAAGEQELEDESHHERRRRKHSSKPPAKQIITYHLIQPKYTGLANKDAGDVKGDMSFIFGTFGKREGNPEANIGNNVFEMSNVTVKSWSSEYQKCNAPGCTAGTQTSCPSSSHDYCCERDGKKLRASATTPPGYTSHAGGYWFSFPRASEGTMWTEKVARRIKGECLAEAWRSEAGGCKDCGKALDQCVAKCIQSNVDAAKLREVWDKAFKSKTMCPDQPLPRTTNMILV